MLKAYYDINIIYVKKRLSKYFVLCTKGESMNTKVKNYSATKDNVKIINRYCIKDNITWLNQSGSAIEFNFVGTKLKLQIMGDSSIYSINPPRYVIMFNDKILFDTLITLQDNTFTIIYSKEEVSGIVKVIKLSEANNGSIGIANIIATSSKDIAITPVPKKNLTIEFIGDSITCGYGVESKNEFEQFSTKTENFMKSYAYLTANTLNADYYTCCYSGHGIVSGYTGDGQKNLYCLVPPYYEIVSSQDEYKTTQWSFEKNPVDLILINLGTNDDSYLKFDYENRSSDFIQLYIDFLKSVRSKNPNAKIICTMGLMGGYKTYEYIQQAINIYISKTNDDNIFCFRLDDQDSINGYGANWHPSIKTQELCSRVVIEKIREILNT